MSERIMADDVREISDKIDELIVSSTEAGTKISVALAEQSIEIAKLKTSTDRLVATLDPPKEA